MANYASINTRQVLQLKKQLADMELTVSDTKQLLTDIGVEMETSMSENITRLKTAPETGKRWEDITEATKAIYNRLGVNTSYSRLLYRTGGLRDSIESQVKSNSVLYGATKFYAAWLNDGTKKMVARPFVGVSSSDEDLLEDIVTNFLRERVKK